MIRASVNADHMLLSLQIKLKIALFLKSIWVSPCSVGVKVQHGGKRVWTITFTFGRIISLLFYKDDLGIK